MSSKRFPKTAISTTVTSTSSTSPSNVVDFSLNKSPCNDRRPKCHFHSCTKLSENSACVSFCDDHCCFHSPGHNGTSSPNASKTKSIGPQKDSYCCNWCCPNPKTNKCTRYCEEHCCYQRHLGCHKSLSRNSADNQK